MKDIDIGIWYILNGEKLQTLKLLDTQTNFVNCNG